MTAPFEEVRTKAPPVRHIILLIGDGMGEAQMDAASIFGFGAPGLLSFEELPYRATVRTQAAEGTVTDSAAAVTAMMTGHKVSYGVLNTAIPGDGSRLAIVSEMLKDRGWAVGVVSTAFFSHATPAGILAHTGSRSDYEVIADQIIDFRPDVLLGGARYITDDEALAAGYTVVKDREAMLALPAAWDGPVFGAFSPDMMPFELDGLGTAPHLFEMTETALERLSRDEEGFFLMVEGALIDTACHDTSLERAVWETLAFSQAAEVAIRFAEAHPEDTLLIVTADHETGGLEVTRNNGAHQTPEVVWHTADDAGRAFHTTTPVSYFGLGPGADPGAPQIDNTDIHDIMMDAVSGTY